MTRSHKITLSLVATICVTLIVFYSVKGNTRPPAPTALRTTAPKPPSAAATPRSPSSTAAELPAAAPAPGAPGAPGSHTIAAPPAGIDEIMARVKQLESRPTGAADTAGPSHAPAPIDPAAAIDPAAPEIAADAPASRPLASAPAAGLATPDGKPDTSAPSSGFTLSDNATSADAASTTDGERPLITDPTVADSTGAATGDDDDFVPSLTLGEPSATPVIEEASPGVDDSGVGNSGIDDRSLADGPSSLFESLPPLVNVAESDPAASTPAAGNATDAKPSTADNGGPATTPAPSAAATPEDAETTTPPSTNDQAVAPPRSTPAPTTADEADAPKAAPARTYTVQPGDSFSSIAARVLGAEKYWMDIADANPGVDPKKVRVGQVINLPELDDDGKAVTRAAEKPAQAESKPQPPAPAAATVADEKIHEVKPGETLSAIARRHYNSADHWRHIYLTNRTTIGGDPGKLQAGMKLKITQPPQQ